VTSLEYDSYFENPSQETSYHVQNSMKFRANELDNMTLFARMST
jgi:hypothetical protein